MDSEWAAGSSGRIIGGKAKRQVFVCMTYEKIDEPMSLLSGKSMLELAGGLHGRAWAHRRNMDRERSDAKHQVQVLPFPES